MFIDARGLRCPKPVMMAEDEVSKISNGIVEILVDNEVPVKSLLRFASKNSIHAETKKVNGYWKVKLFKGHPCEINQKRIVEAGQAPIEEKKDILLIIGTDTIGKEEELGKVLIKGFLETMKVTKEVPHTIFFLNAGVKLTTINEEIIPILKNIEAMGVEIYSCGTCLKHYNVESGLKVGYRGSTNIIVEGIKDFQKIVWI